jgi:hypothetical protein
MADHSESTAILLTPDTITELERAVVEAAMRDHYTRSTINLYNLELACIALGAARKPPDPVGELIAAAKSEIGRVKPDYARLNRAIAAVEATRKDGQ